ncbi:hypothetical protein GJ496_011294 [Pomphorhynchus laevis]|nr:hypothetical protein GJ496_011294 [Pomphorhynchus laevis]
MEVACSVVATSHASKTSISDLELVQACDRERQRASNAIICGLSKTSDDSTTAKALFSSYCAKFTRNSRFKLFPPVRVKDRYISLAFSISR